MNSTITELQQENLSKSFGTESCVLWLGPQVCAFSENGEQVSVQVRLARKLAEFIRQHNKIPFDIDPRLAEQLEYMGQKFLLISNENRVPSVKEFDLRLRIRDWSEDLFKNAEPTPLHRLIAELPFHLIINTNSDQLIVKALAEAGKYKTAYGYYNFRKNEENQGQIPNPSVEAPLVFGLMGCYKDYSSLVVTEAHRVDFFEKFVRNEPRVPDHLMKHLDKDKKHIFLGFNWDDWPLKLLFQRFPDIRDCTNYAPASPADRSVRDFFKEHFQVEFVATSDEEFLLSLKEHLGKTHTASPKQKKIAILRADEDSDDARKLLHQLKPSPNISIWSDDVIEFGKNMEQARQEALEDAHLIALIVSADFLNSPLMDFLPQLTAMKQNGKKVVTIVAKPCQWDTIQALTQMTKILPEGGTPVSLSHQQDLVWKNIAQTLIQLLPEHG